MADFIPLKITLEILARGHIREHTLNYPYLNVAHVCAICTDRSHTRVAHVSEDPHSCSLNALRHTRQVRRHTGGDTRTQSARLSTLLKELTNMKTPQMQCIVLTLICDFDSER